ncbi:DUF5071 domain-containing protein [Paenibacillus jiagnxiensis]|uniref:DUF5071 domain-containing protein n=1 Tax=Paenibacillus jiagnxiensis TaxID=3228926 RepID=UPI0033A4A931
MEHNILPRDKHDFNSVEVLAHLEKSKVIPLLPELLEWLQDMNWPIAPAIVDLLLKYKVETIPHVKTIFSQHDSGWIYNILEHLIKRWDTEFVSSVFSSLRDLAQSTDNDDDTDLIAIEILLNNRLIEATDATTLLERKLNDTEYRLHNFTAEQKEHFAELENERLHILNTSVRQIVNFVKVNNNSLKEKDQYENLLRRYREIELLITAKK